MLEIGKITVWANKWKGGITAPSGKKSMRLTVDGNLDALKTAFKPARNFKEMVSG